MQSIWTAAWRPTERERERESGPWTDTPLTCSINLNLFAKVHMRYFLPAFQQCFSVRAQLCVCVCVYVRCGTVRECQIFTRGMHRLPAQAYSDQQRSWITFFSGRLLLFNSPVKYTYVTVCYILLNKTNIPSLGYNYMLLLICIG